MTPFHLRDKVRVLPGGDLFVRVTVFVLGAAFIVVGVAAIVLPGPLTIPPILVGLAIWSLEFAFAQALLERAKGPARAAWTQAKAHPWRTGVVTVGGLALAVAGAVLASKYGLVGQAVNSIKELLA